MKSKKEKVFYCFNFMFWFSSKTFLSFSFQTLNKKFIKQIVKKTKMTETENKSISAGMKLVSNIFFLMLTGLFTWSNRRDRAL